MRRGQRKRNRSLRTCEVCCREFNPVGTLRCPYCGTQNGRWLKFEHEDPLRAKVLERKQREGLEHFGCRDDDNLDEPDIQDGVDTQF